MAFEDIRAQVVTVVEGLTPDTTRGGAAVFRELPGGTPLEQAALSSGADRMFEVIGGPHAPRDVMTEPAVVHYRGAFEVRLAYLVSGSEPRLTRARFDEDADLIGRNVVAPANYHDDGVGAGTRTQGIFRAAEGPVLDEVTAGDRRIFLGRIPFTADYEVER